MRESDWDYTGNGDGQGFNINVPLNATGMKDTDYLAIFHQILLPVASEVCIIYNLFSYLKVETITYVSFYSLVPTRYYINIIWL